MTLSQGPFERLVISNWRNFASIKISFHPRLTILKGANGSGKSTLLRLLSNHFGWEAVMLSTPIYNDEGALMYTILNSAIQDLKDLDAQDMPNLRKVGRIFYSEQDPADIYVPDQVGITYNFHVQNRASIPGINIPSHRVMTQYQQLNNIPVIAMEAINYFHRYQSEYMIRSTGGRSEFSPVYRMKEALISMATLGPKSEGNRGNPKLWEVFKGFQDTLHIMLPSSLGFIKLEARAPEIVLVTHSGDFPIDASSGGIMAIIDIAWQIYLFSRATEKYVVIIDEPENHLHPSLQRAIMGSLLHAFPKAQFVVATHSPFVVSSVEDSRVYALDYDGEAGIMEMSASLGRPGRVRSVELDMINKAGTAAEVLRDVLGVRVTMPEWVERRLEEIVGDYRNEKVTPELLQRLRGQLDALGYGDTYPDALRKLVSNA